MQTDQKPHLTLPQPPRSSTSRDPEDEVLIRRIAARDAEAFTTLYQRYAPRLTGFLSQRLTQPDLVDDVLHETLLVVWQGAAHFRGQAQLSTWIFCIAQRKAHQARVACQRVSTLPVSLTGTEPEDSEGLLLQRERCHAVTCALAALVPAQRTLLDLSYVQDWSVRRSRRTWAARSPRSRLGGAKRAAAWPLIWPMPSGHGPVRSTRGAPHALTRPRPRCDEDHRLCVMAITSPFDAVAINGMTQGRQERRL